MNKLTKLLSVLAIAGAVGAGASFAAGCSHKHSYSSDWTVENGQHWHAATCKHSDEKADLGDCLDEKINETGETGRDYLCDVCGSDLATHVTEIKLDRSEATLKVGDSLTLRATISPDNASNRNRNWTSSNPAVASVGGGGDAENVVTAKAVGEAIITVTTADGGKTASCKITVTDGDIRVTGIELDLKSVTLKIRESKELRATILPDNATNRNRTWSSSDPSIVSVDNGNNVITAHRAGKATITVTSEDGEYTATCDVTVTNEIADIKPVTGITLNENKATIKVGDTRTLRASILPSDATNKNRVWTSSNPAVASVGEGSGADNVVTAKAVGEAIITVTTEDGNHKATCTVTVTDKDIAVTGIVMDPTEVSLGVGEMKTLRAKIVPDNATNNNRTWSSSNTAVATVQDNVVTAVAPGTAVITVTTEDGNHKATCTVTVTASAPTSGKMSEADFKAAIEATLASDKFTYTAESASIKVDGVNYALAGGKYIVYDATAKKLISYAPVADIAWEKQTLPATVENAAAAKEQMTNGMSLALNAFKSADYSTVEYDENTGKYSVDGAYVTFEGGKVSTYGTADSEITLSDYGASITAPDFTNAFENIVAVKIAKNEVGTKLTVKTENSSYGLYADDALIATSTDYIEATANGYKQTVVNATVNNKGTIISFAKLEGKIEGYFEFSASKVGSKNDMLCLRSGGSKILSLRTGDDSKNLIFRKKVGDGDTATFSDVSGLTPVANTVYKVRYTFEQGSDDKYTATIIINGKAFVTNEVLGVSTLDGFTLGCSNAKVDTKKGTTVVDNVRLITVNNVIICGTPAEGTVVNVENITLNKYETRIEQIGATETLVATVTPDTATDKAVVWSSSDPSVATVDQTGKVTAVKKGDAIISAMTSNGKTIQCKVSVGEKPKPMFMATFYSDGAVVDTQTAVQGGKVLKPADVTKTGYTLKGWSISATSEIFYDFDEPVEKNFSLYAVWEKGESPTPPGPVNPDPVDPNPPIENAQITHSYFGNESAAFEWEETNAKLAKVEYKLETESTYTEVDKELIRQLDADTARVDIIGLKGGARYDFRITPYSGEAIPMAGYRISAYDRSGYAHFNYTEGVGAYKDDGTLKDNAIVLYVTDENKNTVSLTYGGVTVTGIGNILNSVGADTGNGTTSNGGTKPNTNQGIIKKLADANIPLVVRFIGCVSDSGLYKKATFNAASAPKIDGLTIYDSTDHGGSVGDNGHMARIKSGKDITLEGVGEDAVIDGWGFHYMAESSSPNLGKSFEVRNLTFINTPEDAIGMEGVQASKNASSDLSASVERCWIHNNEFYGPNISSPAESDKGEGDGSCDFKRGQYFTCSYNYFEGCHKTNLVGSADYSLQYNLTYHHNYWKLCKARGPLARRANIHMYNNVFEGQTDYAMNTRADAYIFSEYNLFYMCKSPQAVEGGAIKSYNDSFATYIVNKGSMGTVVKDKTQTVSNNCKFAARNIDYSKFDTTASQSYIPSGNYKLQTNVTEARKTIAALAGVNKRNAKTANDIALSEISVVPSGVTPNKVAVPSTVTPGKISKTVYAFTLESSATVTISYSGEGVLVNEAGECLLTGNGSVILNVGTYIVQATNFQPGNSKTLTNGTFKDMTISSISFEKYESEEFNNKLIADYDTKAGLINIDEIKYDNASYQLIQNAQNAYNALSAELKAKVTVPYTTVTAALDKYINSGKAEVEKLINEIGTVSENSGSKITRARTAYSELVKLAPDVTISNYSTLTAAEAAYEQYEVLGVNNAITALANPSEVSGEEALRALLEEYEAVRNMYYDLDEDKRPQVQNTQKVTEGIAALQAALKPYDVKTMYAELPESTAANYLAKVGELKVAYNALTETQKGILTAAEKSGIEAAIAFYDAEMAKTVVVLFAENNSENYDKLSVTVSGNYGKSPFTYDGTSYERSLKIESKTNVSFTLDGERTVVLKISASNTKIKIDGTDYTSDANGEVKVTLKAGTHTITKNASCNLFYMIVK